MKNYIRKIGITVVFTLAMDALLAGVLSFFYQTTTTTDEFKLTQVIRHVDEDILFMGSSRCHHHYIPAIISDTLGTDVYNAGLWGMRNIYFQYGLLSNILERYTPKAIFLEIHPTDYLATPFSDVQVITPLAPFTNYSEGCNEILNVAGIYYKGQISRSYRYNSIIPNIVMGNFTQRSRPEDKGFKQLNGELKITPETLKPEIFNFPKDKRKLHYLQAFIDKCREHSIKLVILYSPMYTTDPDSDLFEIPEEIARKNGIPFINHYDLEGITGNASLFYDDGHLNVAGARKYSAIIASELKSHL